MRIHRLRVAELRQFRQPYELDALLPGLNIFTGPNEAGKSTLVRAIRAAFFERHRSTSVDDLRPYGDSAATPQVEVDFEAGGTPYRLRKSFLHKKRCELLAGEQRLEGVEAEDRLAAMLGFEFALKGASREEHWGVPGLLWIDQGAAQSLREAVGHAADHLRLALETSVGEVAASGGDELTAQVRRLRDELLTGTGKPKAAYLKAIEAVAALLAQMSRLRQAVATYRDQVDRLRQLRDEHAAEERDPPWLALRTQLEQAQRALQAAQALAGEREREAEKLRQATGLRLLLLQRLDAAGQQQQMLAMREATLVRAQQQHEQAQAQQDLHALAEAQALARLQGAQQALRLARQEHNRATLERQLGDARTRSVELQSLLQRAGDEDQRAAALRRDAALQHIEPADLAALRQQQQRLAELAIRQAAVATRLRFDLIAGAQASLAGSALQGQGERLLVAPTTLTIEGVGVLHIAPGGTDLADLAQQHSLLLGEQDSLLQRLGLASPAQAQARALAHAQRLADAAAAEKARQLLAPKGLEALRDELDGAQARLAEAQHALAQLPAPPGEPAPALHSAESQHESSRAAAETTTQQLQQSRQALTAAASQLEAARHERDQLRTSLADPRLRAEVQAQRLEVIEADAREGAARAAVVAIDARIQAARPDILRQDVERLRRSVEQAEARHEARDREILTLQTTLAAAGAQGLEEELATCDGEWRQAQARHDELRRRAAALDFLLQRLEQRRQELTRRLQAPLQQHLDRYLSLLLPSAQLRVDEDLLPGALSRPGPHGPEAADFETLSFGAREQMGVISRLAYADLLRESGRPTLIILDDALVHSDEQRLAAMKRVLFDAAQRHQVLLFTCHPGHWHDMGVPLRALR